MEIVPFEPRMAAEVARCYNELIEPLPDCYPVAADQFASVAGLAHGRVQHEEMLVARARDEVLGFVHVGIALPATSEDEPKGEPGVIRFLSYRPGARSVGQALLEWAEAWAMERGRVAMQAWDANYRYRFYHFGYAHLSERIGHVRALFGMNGYRELGGELYLTWRDFVPPRLPHPEPEIELSLSWREGPIGPRLEARLHRGGKEVGACNLDRGQHSPGPAAAEWCYCDWLWVKEELQGKRLGLYLLCAALAEAKRAGCKHASISTGGNNYRAQLMYTNMGYRVTDYTVCFTKGLGSATGD